MYSHFGNTTLGQAQLPLQIFRVDFFSGVHLGVSLGQFLAVRRCVGPQPAFEERQRLQHLVVRELFQLRPEFGKNHGVHKLASPALVCKLSFLRGRAPAVSLAGCVRVWTSFNWRVRTCVGDTRDLTVRSVQRTRLVAKDSSTAVGRGLCGVGIGFKLE